MWMTVHRGTMQRDISINVQGSILLEIQVAFVLWSYITFKWVDCGSLLLDPLGLVFQSTPKWEKEKITVWSVITWN